MKPNPPPDRSLIPVSILGLQVKLNDIEKALTPNEAKAIDAFCRIGNYMAAAMIYLRKNTLLETPLQPEDIKTRLLGELTHDNECLLYLFQSPVSTIDTDDLKGHWGTCPGLTLVYAHLNLLIKKHDLNMLYITGPGHGAPAILSCLWVEDSLSPFYPNLTRTKEGFAELVKGFSTPGGFPSHVSAEVPGSIHEGGELG